MDMEYKQEPKRGKQRRQTSAVIRDKVLSPSANQSLKFHAKHKVETPLARPYIDRHREPVKHAADGHLQLDPPQNQPKQHPLSKADKDDELVKHMSNLPGYLQRAEKETNIQEKALNFGVLDWKLLEKWKYNEPMPKRVQRKKKPSVSTNTLFVASKPSSSVMSPQRKEPPSHDMPLTSFHETNSSKYVQEAQGKSQIRDCQTVEGSMTNDQRENLQQKTKSSRTYSDINIAKSNRKELDTGHVREKEASALKQVKQWSFSSHDRNVQCGKSKMQLDDAVNLAPRAASTEPTNIVLLVPKHFPKRSSSEISQRSESRTSFDGQSAELKQNKLSGCFSPDEINCEEFYSEFPHSCPLPASASMSTDPTMTPHGWAMDSDAHRRKCLSDKQNTTIVSEAERPKSSKSSMEPSVSIEIRRKIDLDVAEQPVKGRHPSPNRRFSFSLGRMSRSFSFKESSAAPQLSSTYVTTKSGPVRSSVSAAADSNKDKGNPNNRGRSSPLRRLLDPLLRPKGNQSAGSLQPSNGSSSFPTLQPVSPSESHLDTKQQTSTLHALLQLTIKNGLPTFKLVVNNRNDILAAAVKNISKSGKCNSSLIYAFYSVREIKKKSGGWLTQGSKGKSSSFGYNIVGQMKVSSSYQSNPEPEDLKGDVMIRESVLYNNDLGQVDSQTSEVLPDREIMAVIVKSPVVRPNTRGPNSKGNQYKQKGMMQGVHEDICGTGGSTTVILPGGIHGLPNHGAPTSLVARWKSGGLCDCGGWDVGCKLRIFTNRGQNTDSLMTTHYSTLRAIELFVQDGERLNKPIFRLAPFRNGLYAVEFNASISLLQAFAISVSILSSPEVPDIWETSEPSEEKSFLETTTGSDRVNTAISFQDKIPAKYVRSPPPSPVGRI